MCRIGGFGRLIRELRMKYCSPQTCREQLTQGKGQSFAGTELAEASPLSVAAHQVDSRIQDAIEGLQRDFRQRVSTI